MADSKSQLHNYFNTQHVIINIFKNYQHINELMEQMIIINYYK